jgi:hypothetical protein
MNNLDLTGYDIDGVDIPFDTDWSAIAISVSGGADSALLTYLLCDLINKTKSNISDIHIINHIRMWKTRPWQQQHSLLVYNWFVERFTNLNFTRHVNFIAPDIEYGNIGASIPDEYGKLKSGDNISQRSYAEFLCYKEKCNAYYNAVTRNPRNIDLGGMTERDIEPDSSNEHLRLIKHMGGYGIHPFRFVEKSWIIKQYKHNNILDLLNITRSCEGEFQGIDYKSYKPGQYVPICNTCFWCKEREWAIEQSK